MRLVLDVGSGASLPDCATAKRFVEEVARRDSHKHEVVFKAQLFARAPPNIPLRMDVWITLYNECKAAGYKCTASVFDKESLDILLGFDPVFVKIACRENLYWLAGEVPRRIPVYVSDDVPNHKMVRRPYERWLNTDSDDVTCDIRLFCIPNYPADFNEYAHKGDDLDFVSDHTEGWDLLHWAISPQIWEKHLILPDTTGPDAGPWAVTPDVLSEVIS